MKKLQFKACAAVQTYRAPGHVPWADGDVREVEDAEAVRLLGFPFFKESTAKPVVPSGRPDAMPRKPKKVPAKAPAAPKADA